MKSSKKTTVRDIAQRMNVSLSTVNKALTGKPGISEQRRGEIIAVAKEMGYEVNHVAQALSRKPIKIGVLIPSDWQQYFAPIKEGMEKALSNLSHSNVSGEIVHISKSEDILPHLQYFFKNSFDIILYCPSLIKLGDEECEYLKQTKIPLMLVGGDFSFVENICTVSIDSELSGKMAADFLSIPLKKNGKVAVLIGSKQIDTHISKAVSFVERAQKNGLTVVAVHETDDVSENIRHLLEHTLKEHPDLSGIYAATGSIEPIMQCFWDTPSSDLPYIVATDVYESVKTNMKNGKVSATIFQNQMLMGRLSVEHAYNYIVQKTSYSISPQPLPSHIYVTPHLLLPSHFDNNELYSDGNDYRTDIP